MQDTTKMFIVGVVLTVLIVKPTVGIAVAKSFSDGISNVASAMQERDRERDRERAEDLRRAEERQNTLVKQNEQFQTGILSLFEKIIDKLDNIRIHPDDPRIEPIEEIISEPVKPVVIPEGKVKAEETNEKVSVKEFDTQFSHKFTVR